MTLQYSSRSEIAVSHIRKQILSGKLRAGARINQSRMAEELNISLIPLREALKQLEGEGYVEVVSYSGVFVKSLNREEMEDLYIIRGEVEALASTLALPHLDGTVTNKMSSFLNQMDAATAKLDYEKLLSLNQKFHYTLYQASKRKFLLAVLEDFWNRSSRYRIMGTFNPKRAQGALEEHQEILSGCLRRDPEAVSSAVRNNVEHTLMFLRDHHKFDTED